jgi:hypothetical protein
VKYLVLLALLTSCVSLAHVAPQAREDKDREQAAVTVLVDCESVASEMHSGTGVVISERHVLTAAHTVACPSIPRIVIVLADGTRHAAAVTREDANQDIARLEIMHAGRLGLGIAPPKLAPPYVRPGLDLCAYVSNEPPVCGVRLDETLFYSQMEYGDSGAGVYARGLLVGLVIRKVPKYLATRFALVDSSWLEGT